MALGGTVAEATEMQTDSVTATDRADETRYCRTVEYVTLPRAQRADCRLLCEPGATE